MLYGIEIEYYSYLVYNYNILLFNYKIIFIFILNLIVTVST